MHNQIGQFVQTLRAAGVDEPGDPVGQDARLARARAGEDQERPAGMRDGLALGVVEVLEEVVWVGKLVHSAEHRHGFGGAQSSGRRRSISA